MFAPEVCFHRYIIISLKIHKYVICIKYNYWNNIILAIFVDEIYRIDNFIILKKDNSSYLKIRQIYWKGDKQSWIK